jgi:hypothetical protein
VCVCVCVSARMCVYVIDQGYRSKLHSCPLLQRERSMYGIGNLWFHKHFVPEVQAFLTGRWFLQKTMLLLENASSHPRESILTSDDGHNVVKFMLPSIIDTFNAHGPKSNCIHETMLPGWPQNYCQEDIIIIALLKKLWCWTLYTVYLRHSL